MAKKGTYTESNPMSWDQFQTLISRMANDIEHNIEDPNKKRQHVKFLLLISIGCYCGLRINDILHLKWEDILNRSTIDVVESKTKKIRRITLNRSLRSLIEKYHPMLINFPSNGYLFTNRSGLKILSVQYVNRHLKKILKQYKIKVKNASTHTLRKTFGRRVFDMNYKSDEALITLSQIFNHSSTAITRRYIGLQSEQIRDVYLSL